MNPLHDDRGGMSELKIAHGVGLTFILLLTVLIYFMLGSMVDGQRSYAKIINIAGRQRMLSQRIAIQAIDLKNGDAAAQKPLLDSVALMERSQNALVDGADLGVLRGLSPQARRYYFEGPQALDPLVRKYLTAARRFGSDPQAPDAASAYAELQSMARANTVPALNEAVLIFEGEAEARLDRIRFSQDAALIAIFLIMILETSFVFIPLSRKISQYVRSLQNRDDELEVLLAKTTESNAWLQMAEQTGHIGHWRLTLPDYSITWSDEVYRIFGVSPETFKPDLENAIAVYHPDDRAKVTRDLEKAIAEKSSFDFTLRLLRGDGETRHVQCRGVTQLRANGDVGVVFGVVLDITEQRNIETALREANRKLDDKAYIDGLTNIPNRRKFDEEIARAWRVAARAGDSLSIAMIDVDHFKAYNDTYGHQAGDECLRAVARAINNVAKRPGDVTARYGGEEFVIMLPSTDAAGALMVAERTRQAVEALAIAHAKSTAAPVVSVSIGVACVKPDGEIARGKEDLIAEADALLYQAKRSGRNRVMSRAQAQDADALRPPIDEDARLAALAAYQEAGATRRTPELDRIARMAATLMDVPIGLISIVGADEQTFAGNFGLDGVDFTRKDVSFCAHTILGEDPMVVHDATQDPRFEDNALVTGELGIRYYAGAPIVSKSTGHHLGALCVIDRSARTATSATQRALISDLADMAATVIEDNARSAAKRTFESLDAA